MSSHTDIRYSPRTFHSSLVLHNLLCNRLIILRSVDCAVLHMQLLVDSGIDDLLRLLTLEHERQLLEGAVVRLWEEEVHRRDFDKDPNAVHDVVLPADGVQRDWINVGVEEDGEADGELFDSDTFGTLLEGEYFDHVGVSECVPTNVVKATIPICQY